MSLNLFAYMNKIGLSIPPILLEEVHCVREEVEAFYKACNLPNAPDVDEFGDNKGFEDDELLFYE